MATFIGISDRDALDDLSRAELAGLPALHAALTSGSEQQSAGTDDGRARDVLIERLEVQSDTYESGWAHANLNVMSSPLRSSGWSST